MIKKWLNERGSASFFVYFVSLAFFLLVLFAIVIPMLQTFNVAIYEGAEDILLDGNAVAGEIQDANIRATLQGAFGAQTDSIVTQVDILGTFFLYGWIIVIVVIALAFFMITRQTVEIGMR